MPPGFGAAEWAGTARACTSPELDPGPHRYCVPRTIRWRGDDPCFGCGRPGLLREMTPPPGWPTLTLTHDVAPGAAA